MWSSSILTFASVWGFKVRVALRSREYGCARGSPFRKLVWATSVHFELLVVVVIARSWYCHWSAHQVHINTLACIMVAWWDHVELSACATLYCGDETETILVLCRKKIISAWARESFSRILEAWILSGLWPAWVHYSFRHVVIGCVIIASRSWHWRVSLKVFLDKDLLKVITRETKAKSSYSRILDELWFNVVLIWWWGVHCTCVHHSVKPAAVPQTCRSLWFGVL